MNNTFKLGRSIALFVPFYRKLHKKREEIFSNKILILMGIVTIAKVAVFLMLWYPSYFVYELYTSLLILVSFGLKTYLIYTSSNI